MFRKLCWDATVQPNLWEGCILNSFLNDMEVSGSGGGAGGARAPFPLPNPLPLQLSVESRMKIPESCGAGRSGMEGSARAHSYPPLTRHIATR